MAFLGGLTCRKWWKGWTQKSVMTIWSDKPGAFAIDFSVWLVVNTKSSMLFFRVGRSCIWWTGQQAVVGLVYHLHMGRWCKCQNQYPDSWRSHIKLCDNLSSLWSFEVIDQGGLSGGGACEMTWQYSLFSHVSTLIHITSPLSGPDASGIFTLARVKNPTLSVPLSFLYDV